MKAASRALWGLIAASVVLQAQAQARAGQGAAGTVDPEARALLGEVSRAYKALPAYADRGELFLSYSKGRETGTVAVPLGVALVRPNKVRVETPVARLVCDGKTLTTVAEPLGLNKYETQPAPGVVTFDTLFTAGAAGSSLFGSPGSALSTVFLHLLLGDDPGKTLLEPGTGLTLGPDRDEGGRPFRVLVLTTPGRPPIRLLVDRENLLLQSVEYVVASDALSDTLPASLKMSIQAYQWRPRRVSLSDPGPSAFADPKAPWSLAPKVLPGTPAVKAGQAR
jgi:hypothetical protein